MGRRNIEKKIPRGTHVVLKEKPLAGEDYYTAEKEDLPFVDESHLEKQVVNFDKVKTKKRLSAKEKKRLQKVIERKEKAAIRTQLYEQINAHKLSLEAISSFRSITSLSDSKLKKRKLAESQKSTEEDTGPASKATFHPDFNAIDAPKVHNAHLNSMDKPLKLVKKNSTPEQPRPAPTSFLAFALSLHSKPAQQITIDDLSSSTDNDNEDVDDDDDNEGNGDVNNYEIESKTSALNSYVPNPIINEEEEDLVRKETTVLTSFHNLKPNYVIFDRTKEIQDARVLLPIFMEEQRIMETIMANPVTVICGETGSGKTTQVPQFLLESGFANPSGEGLYPGKIAVTEPRRVAAISMAERVGAELNNPSLVGYQIRYDAQLSENTRLKFLTDGVLLKEIERDFLLSEYSAVIIDEAHERSLNTDILIGLLSRIAQLRNKMYLEEKQAASAGTPKESFEALALLSTNAKPRSLPLKLIIMSATLRVDDFAKNSKLFPIPPPVLCVEARQHPVTIHFNKKTPEKDYVYEAYKKVRKIHERMDAGGILVFVSSQREVNALVRRLRMRYNKGQEKAGPDRSIKESLSVDSPVSASGFAREADQADTATNVPGDTDNDNDDNEEDDEEDDFLADFEDILADDYSENELEESSTTDQAEPSVETEAKTEIDSSATGAIAIDKPKSKPKKMKVLPLYALLPKKQQMSVFEAVPADTRLVVIATNVAETSITIPNVKYVVDTGKVKEKMHDPNGIITEFQVVWCSQASSMQRAGRAGRTGPGHCYRLYSSAVYQNYFQKFADPEVLRLPIEGLVLMMKNMGIDNVQNFPFPTAPDADALHAAIFLLKNLGAIDAKIERITKVGALMAQFPIAPRYAKMLVTSLHTAALPYVICIAASLAVGNVFSDKLMDKTDKKSKALKKAHNVELPDAKELSQEVQTNSPLKKWAGSNPESDLMAFIRAIGAFEFSNYSEDFCEKNGLIYKSMVEVQKLRGQLIRIVNAVESSTCKQTCIPLSPPKTSERMLIYKSLLSAYGDQLAWKSLAKPNSTDDQSAQRLKHAFSSELTESPVYIHPTSSLYNTASLLVLFIGIEVTSKMYLKLVTNIDKPWLTKYTPERCTFSAPLPTPAPHYCQKLDNIVCFCEVFYGPKKWPMGLMQVPFQQDSLDLYKYFAYELLQGKIIPAFSRLAAYYLATPISMVKIGSQERVIMLSSALAKKKIHTKALLLKAWVQEPRFLFREIGLWLAQENLKILRDLWPSLTSA